MTLRTWNSVWARASSGRTQSPTTFAHNPNAIAASSSLVTRSAIWGNLLTRLAPPYSPTMTSGAPSHSAGEQSGSSPATARSAMQRS